jgi:hypothetical protein
MSPNPPSRRRWFKRPRNRRGYQIFQLKPAKRSKITKFGRILKVKHPDYQPLHRLLPKRVYLVMLIINYLQDFSN